LQRCHGAEIDEPAFDRAFCECMENAAIKRPTALGVNFADRQRPYYEYRLAA